MPWKRIRFCLYVVLLWPAAIFVGSNVEGRVAPILWRLLQQSGGTTLPRATFDTDAWLPIMAALGFLFGFIPLEKLKTILLAVVAPGRIRVESDQTDELNPARPTLWVWVLPAAAVLFRFSTLTIPNGHSVLGANQVSPQPLSYFFGGTPPDTYLRWFYDRLFFTSPMLFTGAYALTVVLRHRLPIFRQPFPAPVNPAPVNPDLADTLGS